jgi:predicted ABC-type transport system involved in lysophospholipase L1 biosynthesis ATPase subunit
MMVLIARTVSMGGGGCSLQAINAEIRTTKDSSPNRAGAPLKTKNEPTIDSRRLTNMGFVFGFNIFMLIELLIYAPKRC